MKAIDIQKVHEDAHNMIMKKISKHEEAPNVKRKSSADHSGPASKVPRGRTGKSKGVPGGVRGRPKKA